MQISRRQFLGTTGTFGAIGILGLAGCSPSGGASVEDDEAQEVVFDVVETVDCDIVVIGAGASGLAATVQAAELGASVLCLESMNIHGGNINGVEGCFGIGSTMQKERNIEIDPGSTIRMELAASQQRANGPGYLDMVNNSGENIDWLVADGVTFGGVDVDKGTMEVFHRFASGHGKKDYADPMYAKAQELGATFRFSTHAHTLIKDETGKICGVYADGEEGTIQVNAQAVIIATGGFAQNEELMAGVSRNKNLTYGGFDGHDGSGHLMAVDAGAKSYRDNTALLIAFDIEGTPGYYDGGKFAFVLGVAAPYAVWVNQDGERFTNEDAPGENAMLMFMPSLAFDETFVVMDANMLSIYAAGEDDVIAEQIESGIEYGSIFKAGTIEELGDAMGVGSKNLASTIGEYNGFVEAGSDRNYGKSADCLIPMQQAPFYALRISGGLNSTIGSIYTDRSFHALDENFEPMDGLYAVGVEGAMLWSNLYTINVSGGCNANNVNSGRVAAKDAFERLS